MIQRWKRWGLLVLVLLTLGLVVACQRNSSPLLEQSACTPVKHFAGTTCVPNSFERLVTLDSVGFEDAIALNIKPIATTISSDLPAHLSDRLDDVKDIGQPGEPNLENVVALNPDLIMGLDSYQQIYAQTTQIAPTVLYGFEHSGQWKEAFQTIGKILGRADTAQQVMDDYRKRLEEFKTKMGINANSSAMNRPPKVSVIRIYPDSINLYLRDSFPGTVLQDAGLARPPAQNLSADEAQSIANNPIQIAISRESLRQVDGDVLFVWTGENEAEADREAQKKLQQLQNDPFWKKLNVVQNNKVYFVPNYWIGSGPIAANAILDDLFKYLVKAPQS